MRLIEKPKSVFPPDIRFPGCIRCGQNDHPQLLCPVQDVKECYNCGIGGHFKGDCPFTRLQTESEPSAFAGGDPVKADPSLAQYYMFPLEGDRKKGSTPDFRSGVEGKAPPSALPSEGASGEKKEADEPRKQARQFKTILRRDDTTIPISTNRICYKGSVLRMTVSKDSRIDGAERLVQLELEDSDSEYSSESGFEMFDEAWPMNKEEVFAVNVVTRSGTDTKEVGNRVPQAPNDRKAWKIFNRQIPGYADMSSRRR